MSSDFRALTDWMNKAGAKPLLSHFETDQIARKIQQSEIGSRQYKKLVNKLVEHNLRLVVKFVHTFMSYKSSQKWGSVETLDYLQIGSLGLIRAVEKFDPDMGYKFSTYANYWIRSFVGRYNMRASSPFSVTEGACRNAYFFEVYGTPKPKRSGLVPDYEETKQAVETLRMAQCPVSLNIEIGKEEGYTLLDTLISEPKVEQTSRDGCFDDEMEDAMVSAGLSQEQIELLRKLYIAGTKPGEIKADSNLTSHRYNTLKAGAMALMKNYLTQV